MSDSTQVGNADRKDSRVMKILIGVRDWTDARLPIVAAWKKHMSNYYAPKKFQLLVFLWRSFVICTRNPVS